MIRNIHRRGWSIKIGATVFVFLLGYLTVAQLLDVNSHSVQLTNKQTLQLETEQRWANIRKHLSEVKKPEPLDHNTHGLDDPAARQPKFANSYNEWEHKQSDQHQASNDQLNQHHAPFRSNLPDKMNGRPARAARVAGDGVDTKLEESIGHARQRLNLELKPKIQTLGQDKYDKIAYGNQNERPQKPWYGQDNGNGGKKEYDADGTHDDGLGKGPKMVDNGPKRVDDSVNNYNEGEGEGSQNNYDKERSSVRNGWENNFMYDGFQEDEIGVRLPHGSMKMANARGSVWPKPERYKSKETLYLVDTTAFRFEAVGASCPILNKAFKRYEQLIQQQVDLFFDPEDKPSQNPQSVFPVHLNKPSSFISQMPVNVQSCPTGTFDTIPTEYSDESYTIRVDRKTKSISANQVWGALRALESFSQLLWVNKGQVVTNATLIVDKPRFSHRGVMLDTARHFIPVSVIKRLLMAMSYNKFNVFHWHIVDDHSFPLQVKAFPNLHKKGAYSPNMTYSASDVRDIIRFSADRGIRVIPELDTPGHVRSWGLSYPSLISNCSDSYYPYGPLNPLRQGTYDFLDVLFKEIVQTFPDSHIHIGGDECDYQCWYRNTETRAYMVKNNMTLVGENFDGDIVKKLDGAALHGVFTKKLVQEVLPANRKKIAWEEVLNTALAGNMDRKSLVINIWKGGGGEFIYELQRALEQGFDAIVSSCWYLNYISYGKDWTKYYTCDPEGNSAYNYNGVEPVRQSDPEHIPGVTPGRLLGSEVCIWTEFIDETNLEPILWPRALAAAERFWSPKSVEYIPEETDERFDAQHCRLRRRGIQSSPNSGPGACEGRMKVKYPY